MPLSWLLLPGDRVVLWVKLYAVISGVVYQITSASIKKQASRETTLFALLVFLLWNYKREKRVLCH